MLLNRSGLESFGHACDEDEDTIHVLHATSGIALMFPRPVWDREAQTHLFDDDFCLGYALHRLNLAFIQLSHKKETHHNFRVLFNKVGVCCTHQTIVQNHST